MPSSITLTVSHLPTSTSFFLAALQPLDYAYRGRTNNTIGFGSSLNPSLPPDFWITQEVPGVPAGAAHVAFLASSHKRVQHFFTAALKAGAKIHGEPAVRDSSGYYSAAVIDFDGNSIEAVYRPSYSDDKENVVSKSIVSRSSTSRSDTSPSRSFRDRNQERRGSGDILDNLFAEARNAANVARKAVQKVRPSPATFRSEPMIGSKGSGDNGAVIGTLLGAAAGAVLTYAFTSGRDDSDDRRRRPAPPRSNTTPIERLSEHDQTSYGSKPRPGSLITVEEIEYKSTRPTNQRRSSTSVISTSSTDRSGRPLSSRSRGSSHSRFEPIRMIETAPSPPRSRTTSSRGSQASTIKPKPSSDGGGTTRSKRSKTYPPSAFPPTYPLTPPDSSSPRRYPPSRSPSYNTPQPQPPPSRPSTTRTPSSTAKPPDLYHPSHHPGSRSLTKNDGRYPNIRGVTDEEVRPEDSISQISCTSSSRSSSSRDRSRDRSRDDSRRRRRSRRRG